MKRHYITSVFLAIVALLASTYNVYGQVEKKKYLREGNSQYKKARYPIADSLYAMAVMNDTSYATGYYNRGNALYLGGDAASAHAQWMKALMNTPGEEEKADILYNLGGLQMDASICIHLEACKWMLRTTAKP